MSVLPEAEDTDVSTEETIRDRVKTEANQTKPLEKEIKDEKRTKIRKRIHGKRQQRKKPAKRVNQQKSDSESAVNDVLTYSLRSEEHCSGQVKLGDSGEFINIKARKRKGKQFGCTVCGETFPTKSALNMHLETEHDVKPAVETETVNSKEVDMSLCKTFKPFLAWESSNMHPF